MYYEQIVRGQIAAERIERIAAACARPAGQRGRRSERHHLSAERKPALRPGRRIAPAEPQA